MFLRPCMFFLIVHLAPLLMLFLISCSPSEDDECKCAPTAIRLFFQDESGNPLTVDSVSCTLDGNILEVDTNQGEFLDIIGGAGSYNLEVTRGNTKWISETYNVKISGPDNCRRPETFEITLIFFDNQIQSSSTIKNYCN